MTVEPGGWQIVWGDRVWSENDLTGTHAALIVMLSGKDAWSLFDPFAGPVTLMQILAAFISLDEKRDPLAVVGELTVLPLTRMLAAVSVVE